MIPRLTFAHLRAVHDATGLDLLAIADESVWATVIGDARWNAEAARVLTGEELSGDDLGEFMGEFRQRLIEFFPAPAPESRHAKVQGESSTPVGGQWQKVFQAAGAVGVEPWGYSMRELLWMADGAWKPYSALIAKIHNSHCQKKSELITPDSVNPYCSEKKMARKRYPKSYLLNG